MKHAIILILGILLTMRVAVAQDTFPPDASEIFTDAVEVIETEFVAGQPPSYAYDDETRILTVFNDDGQIQAEYPYPDDLEDIWNARLRSDGILVIEFQESYNYDDVYNADAYWLFNLATGEFSRPEVVCDNQLQALAGEGEWRYYSDDPDEHEYLCFTEDGTLLDILPQEFAWVREFSYGSRNLPRLASFGEWLVLTGYERNETGDSNVTLYSYQISSGTLNNIGQVVIPNSAGGFSFWCSLTTTNCTAVISANHDYLSSAYYVFDAAQPDSIEYAFSGWGAHYLQTNWFVQSTTGSMTREHLNCVFYLIDERGARSYDLGYDCGMRSLNNDMYDTCVGLDQIGGDYYYLRFEDNPSTTSAIMRLNVETGESIRVLQGEIEALLAVSPDGRYLMLVNDHSGQINRVDRGCEAFNWDGFSTTQLVIYDTVNESFVYHSAALGGQGASIRWLETGGFLVGLDGRQDRFYVNGDDSYSMYTSDTLNLVLSDSIRTLQGIDYDVEIVAHSPDERQFITREGMLINFTTMSRTALLGEQFLSGSRVPLQYEWNDDGTINVTLTTSEGSVTYTIRVTPQT